MARTKQKRNTRVSGNAGKDLVGRVVGGIALGLGGLAILLSLLRGININNTNTNNIYWPQKYESLYKGQYKGQKDTIYINSKDGKKEVKVYLGDDTKGDASYH
ncbi:MAG: hypothetical protein QXW65_02100 [Candidatus Pacearchaeota archaeon]